MKPSALSSCASGVSEWKREVSAPKVGTLCPGAHTAPIKIVDSASLKSCVESSLAANAANSSTGSKKVWIAFIGDSIAREVFNQVVDLLGARGQVVVKPCNLTLGQVLDQSNKPMWNCRCFYECR